MMLSRHTDGYLHASTGYLASSANVIRVEPGAGVTRERDPANLVHSISRQHQTGNRRNQNVYREIYNSVETEEHRDPQLLQRMQHLVDTLGQLSHMAVQRQNHAISLVSKVKADSMAGSGSSVRLHGQSGDGQDVVQIPPGVEIIIQLGAGIDTWQTSREGDALTLLMPESKVRFEGLANSGAIGLVLWGDNRVKFLHLPPVLNKTV